MQRMLSHVRRVRKSAPAVGGECSTRGETHVADSVCDSGCRFDLCGGVWNCTGCADCAAAPGLHGRPWNLVGCAVAPLLAWPMGAFTLPSLLARPLGPCPLLVILRPLSEDAVVFSDCPWATWRNTLQTFRGIAAAGSWVQNPLLWSSTQWVTGNADGTRNGPVDRTALRHRDYLRRDCRTGRQSCVRLEFNSRIGPRHLFLQQEHGASWLTAMILPSVCLHRFTILTLRKSSPAVET